VTNIKIDAIDILNHFPQASVRLKDYLLIMDQYSKVDVSIDAQFQKVFNRYYRVRRNLQWREQYYSLFQRVKSAPPTFEAILRQLYGMTGRVETSFASKMLATIDSENPIWDSRVLNVLGHSQNYNKRKEERIVIAIEKYDQIKAWYREYLKTEEALACIKIFDEHLPDCKDISSVKKIDFFLWAKP
jgi:hypothetical protein